MQHKITLNAYTVTNSFSSLRLTAVRLIYSTITDGMYGRQWRAWFGYVFLTLAIARVALFPSAAE